MTITKWQGISLAFLIFALGSVGHWGLRRLLDNPKLAAAGRNELFADSEYSKQIKALEKKREKIGDRQFYKELARLEAVQNYRVNAGKNPMSQVCEVSIDEEGDTKSWDIPSACDEGFQPWIYHDGPKRTFEVGFTTGEGDPIGVFPTFIAGRGSAAECDKENWKCVFEGDVYYRHENGGRHRILKITPVK